MESSNISLRLAKPKSQMLMKKEPPQIMLKIRPAFAKIFFIK